MQRLRLPNSIAKKGSGRTIPLHRDIKALLLKAPLREGFLIRSERRRRLRASSVVNWFHTLYRQTGLLGCSSHSGRRTFITAASRSVHRAGGSLRDVQQLAGHRSLLTTQAYIDAYSPAKLKLINLI